MPPLKNKSGIKKIDISDIILKENVRFDYREIEELANSIERDGQLQPVIVDSENNLIAGYRRFKAHEFLVNSGKPFNQIEAVIKTGNFEILQLTENIQRSKLSAIELEKALKKMIDSGMSQKEIAERLNKRLSWVSDCLAACKVRESIKENTENISSTAMSQLRSVPKKELSQVIKQVKKNGGTVTAAKNAIKKDPFDNIKKEAIKLKKIGYDAEEIVEEIRGVL